MTIVGPFYDHSSIKWSENGHIMFQFLPGVNHFKKLLKVSAKKFLFIPQILRYSYFPIKYECIITASILLIESTIFIYFDHGSGTRKQK